MVATMGPPRTPPRKRHRSKTSQPPRVSTRSSASSSKVARPSALRNPNLTKYKYVKDVKDSKGKEVKGSKAKEVKADKVKDRVKEKKTKKESKKKDRVKDTEVKDLSKVKKDKLKEKKRNRDAEKEKNEKNRSRGAEKEKKTKDNQVEGKETTEVKSEKAAQKTGENVETKEMPKDLEKTKEKKQKNEKKDEKIQYIPCKRGQIDHLFKAQGAAPSPSASTSSKEKAQAHLASLTQILQESDDDSFSSLDATDLDQFTAAMQSKGIEEDEAQEEEDQEESQESNDEGSDEYDEEQDEEDEEQDDEDEKTPGLTQIEEDQEESVEEGEEESDEEEDEVVEEKDDKDKKADQHALVPVTSETALAVADMKTSATHKREWDAFMRQLKSNTKTPIAVSEYATSHANKVDLFNMWLGSNRDWSQCELHVKRQQEKKNEGVKGWQAVQGSVLKTRYTPEKWEKLKESRKASGLWYPDTDFPDDDDDPHLKSNNFCLVSPQYWISRKD